MIKFGRPVSMDVEARFPSLVEALASDELVEAIWLFGSRARGEADTLSDVDIAVLARHGLDNSTIWERQLAWTAAAVQALGTDEVGVQVMNRLRLAYRYGVLRDARLLWARSPEAAADFEARTLKEYFDLRPLLDRYDRDLLRQAASGRLR